MKTQKRRANPLRRAYHDIVRQEIVARPGCALVHSVGVDEDGRTYIHFTCLSHDSASWRYYIHVYVDTELASQADPRFKLHSRCPPVRQGRVADRQDDTPAVSPPEIDSSAQVSHEETDQSLEEWDDVPEELT